MKSLASLSGLHMSCRSNQQDKGRSVSFLYLALVCDQLDDDTLFGFISRPECHVFLPFWGTVRMLNQCLTKLSILPRNSSSALAD